VQVADGRNPQTSRFLYCNSFHVNSFLLELQTGQPVRAQAFIEEITIDVLRDRGALPGRARDIR
jgi:hypothetical protein